MNYYQYKMSRACYNALLKKRSGETEKKMKPNDYVCWYVNQTYGLRQKVSHIIVED